MGSSERYRSNGNQGLSDAVVEAIAEHQGVDPTALVPPLYEVLDPDALDALFAPTHSSHHRSTGHVRFTYRAIEVTVESDGTVSIRKSDDCVE